jgi:D-alanyl-D-alanine carboxypeptidase/D-alanyl-D-alanine-endopeptidase (penicillin-binding protein 4)
MKSILAVLIFVLALIPASVCRADLASDIRAILRDKYLTKAEVGVAVAKLSDGGQTDVIYRFESDIPLIPASNLKVLTTSAFLDRLGPEFRFRTMLLMKDNDLFLIGDGDPSLGDVEMLKKLGWDVDTVFKAWAEELKKRNITSVRNVYVDDSVFDEEFLHPNWLSRYLGARYAAQVGGVNLNANCIDIWVKATARGQLVNYTKNPDTNFVTIKNQCVTGTDNAAGVTRPPGKNDLTLRGEVPTSLGEPISVPIQDPPMFAVTVLAETIAKSGVQVGGVVGRDRGVRDRYAADSAGWSVVAALDTKLSTVLDRANKDSMNLYAEALCKRLGRDFSGGQPGSWQNGTAAMADFLKRVGVPEAQFKLDDGCGLSRENSVSPNAMLTVLSHNFHGKNREIFLNSLAVGGQDGTFERRFKNDLRGRVFGKSGYVSGVSALSGYLKAQNGEWYAFSILMNKVPEGTNSTAKIVQEKIVTAIDENAK